MVGLKPSEVPPTTAVKFLGAGSAACFADLLTYPLDTAKVRLQVGALWSRAVAHIKGGAEFSTTALALSASKLSSGRTLSRPLAPLLKTLPRHLPVTITQDKEISIPRRDVTGPFKPSRSL